MLTREQLQGVLLSLPKTEITVRRDERHIVGYAVRLGVHFRANENFLTAIHRTLHQYEIESKWKDVESKVRPKPIVSIRGVENLRKVCDLVPTLPDYRNQWDNFKQVVLLVENDDHYSQEGIDEILHIKGVL
jgi:hypothetical protein